MATVAPLRERLGVVQVDEVARWHDLFVYGDPGVGKTWLCGTAQDCEDTMPTLHLDIEGGTETIRKRKDYDVVVIRNMKKLVEVQNMLYRENDLSYRCIILDNMSELQQIDMKVIMEAAYSKNPDKVDKDVPGQREWGKSREHMRGIIRAFRDLPCHTILTAHVVTEKNEGEPDRYFPGFGGRTKTEAAGFVNIVGYMTVDQVKEGKAYVTRRKIQFVGSRRVIAKDRSSLLGDYMENPTIPKIWEKLNAKI